MRTIYVDMDDVLTESNLIFLDVLEREFNKKVGYEDIHTFDLKVSFGLTEDEFERFFECIHQEDEMMKQTPVPGSKETLQHWQDQGYEVKILTGRPVASEGVSVDWLARHGYAYDSFTIVDKYNRAASKGNGSMSLERLAECSFDLAIEDSGKMAQFLSETMGVQVALLERPWNRSMDFNGNVARCADWQEIKTRFERV
ncbi:MAG: bifunctional metallophosphatase/5'-nucleotidase [Desulfobacteraceae bacterium]|nr:MAG: bifunctional metallophosphatase/5'-nucleotidase [Desulfobacteraceae bacterium]